MSKKKTKKKVLWSLFDGSGIAGYEYAKAGWQVYCFNADDADHGEYVVKMQHPNLHYVNCWINEEFDPTDCGSPDLIFSFPQCTFMANCGAKHEREDEAVERDVRLARVSERLGDKYNCPWLTENPVGKLCTKWRKPDHYFDPYEYGAYLDEDEGSFHKRMPACDGYTKRTGIWCGNGFVMPDKKPGPINVGYFWAWRFTGGKSNKTKQLRSLSPRGFFRAVFEFNH